MSLAVPENLIRVVGTNGKGSVSAMLAAGLTAAGHVTGRFVSPHVERFNERIAVDGEPVSDEQLTSFVNLVRARAGAGAATSRQEAGEAAGDHERLRPAFFEYTLALALRVFAAAGVTHAVLEAGVGGASDATSAAVRPGANGNLRLVVLTNVDLDHVETLGTTIAAIAADKAGAFAAGVPAVTGASGAALAVARRLAQEHGAVLYVDDGLDPLFDLPPGLAPERSRPGSTRVANARLAAAGLRLLGVAEDNVVSALSIPPLPGRGERFAVAGRRVILDGAHDPAAARRLVADLEGEPGASAGADYVLLFGSLARKQGFATLAPLAERAAAVIITAADPHDDLTRFAGTGHRLESDPQAALRLALESTPPGGTLLVAGSLYLAGLIRPLLRAPALDH